MMKKLAALFMALCMLCGSVALADDAVMVEAAPEEEYLIVDGVLIDAEGQEVEGVELPEDIAEIVEILDAEIDTEMAREADYLFTIRVRNFLMEKAGLQMPEAFLKRWLYTINEGKFSMEEIEKDFDGFLKMFTWNYIQKHFIQTYELTVSQEEVEAEAKEFAKAQFAQYGMPSAPEEMIANFSKQILENKEQAQKIYEKLYELKVVEYVKSKIKVSTKSVTSEEFAKLAQEI
jgi:trigger factor